MLSKKLFLTLVIFIMCFVEIFGFTSYAADTKKTDSSDNEYHKMYFDDFNFVCMFSLFFLCENGYIAIKVFMIYKQTFQKLPFFG